MSVELRRHGQHARCGSGNVRAIAPERLARGLFCLLLFLAGLPFRLLSAVGKYLEWKTRMPVRWPAVVL